MTRIPRETLTQTEVNDLLVHHGLRGRAVVRLKGGDPFVFGRGGEEVEALAAAGIPHEIVPGVSTLTAVPALAGIPLTHRGVAAQVTVLTGTSGDGADLDYARLAGTPGTLVIFMGLGRLAWIADNLILNGRSFMEPAAVVSRASLPDTRVVVGTLGTIAGTAADPPSPSLVIVGEVAKLAWQVRTRPRGGRRADRRPSARAAAASGGRRRTAGRRGHGGIAACGAGGCVSAGPRYWMRTAPMSLPRPSSMPARLTGCGSTTAGSTRPRSSCARWPTCRRSSGRSSAGRWRTGSRSRAAHPGRCGRRDPRGAPGCCARRARR